MPFDVAVDGAAPKPGNGQDGGARLFDPPSPEWQRADRRRAFDRDDRVQPGSGPGTAADPAYTQVIAQAQAAGIVMLGYVATAYGARPEADVIADINRYYDLYAPSRDLLRRGADGQRLHGHGGDVPPHVRTRCGRAIHAAYLAVGTRFCPTYIIFFDMMVQFARNWTEYQTDYAPPCWMPANSPQRFVHFVHSVPAAEAERALSRAIANGAGWVFITDQGDPNPWSVLPSYFNEELATTRARVAAF